MKSILPLCLATISFFYLMFAPISAGNALAAGSGLIPCGTERVEGVTKEQATQIANDCKFEGFIVLFRNVINFLLFVLAMPLAALLFCYAGFLYLTAQGDEGQVKKAHQIFFYVVVGFSTALAAWLIVQAIVTGLNVDLPGSVDFLG